MKKFIYIFVGIVLAVGIGVLAYTQVQKANLAHIQTFEDCKTAGYPVMESYPERCNTPDGRSFTGPINTISPSPITSGEGENPPGSIHNMPVPEAVSKTREALAEKLGMKKDAIIVLEALEKEWPDACLGAGGPDEMCAQVITPGYAIKLHAAGLEYDYRTNMSGSLIVAVMR